MDDKSLSRGGGGLAGQGARAKGANLVSMMVEHRRREMGDPSPTRRPSAADRLIAVAGRVAGPSGGARLAIAIGTVSTAELLMGASGLGGVTHPVNVAASAPEGVGGGGYGSLQQKDQVPGPPAEGRTEPFRPSDLNGSGVSQDFGCTPNQFEQPDPSCASGYDHFGVDYTLRDHSPMFAVTSGTIVVNTHWGYNKDDKTWGWAVYLLGDDGYLYSYGHMSRIDVTTGERVPQAKQLGLSGGAASDPGHGMSTGAHDHQEIHKGHEIDAQGYPAGPLVNPRPLIRALVNDPHAAPENFRPVSDPAPAWMAALAPNEAAAKTANDSLTAADTASTGASTDAKSTADGVAKSIADAGTADQARTQALAALPAKQAVVDQAQAADQAAQQDLNLSKASRDLEAQTVSGTQGQLDALDQKIAGQQDASAGGSGKLFALRVKLADQLGLEQHTLKLTEDDLAARTAAEATTKAALTAAQADVATAQKAVDDAAKQQQDAHDHAVSGVSALPQKADAATTAATAEIAAADASVGKYNALIKQATTLDGGHGNAFLTQKAKDYQAAADAANAKKTAAQQRIADAKSLKDGSAALSDQAANSPIPPAAGTSGTVTQAPTTPAPATGTGSTTRTPDTGTANSTPGTATQGPTTTTPPPDSAAGNSSTPAAGTTTKIPDTATTPGAGTGSGTTSTPTDPGGGGATAPGSATGTGSTATSAPDPQAVTFGQQPNADIPVHGKHIAFVGPGQTLADIAAQHAIDEAALAAANPDFAKPGHGDVVMLPAGATVLASDAYQVGHDDTTWSIERHFGLPGKFLMTTTPWIDAGSPSQSNIYRGDIFFFTRIDRGTAGFLAEIAGQELPAETLPPAAAAPLPVAPDPPTPPPATPAPTPLPATPTPLPATPTPPPVVPAPQPTPAPTPPAPTPTPQEPPPPSTVADHIALSLRKAGVPKGDITLASGDKVNALAFWTAIGLTEGAHQYNGMKANPDGVDANGNQLYSYCWLQISSQHKGIDLNKLLNDPDACAAAGRELSNNWTNAGPWCTAWDAHKCGVGTIGGKGAAFWQNYDEALKAVNTMKLMAYRTGPDVTSVMAL